MSNVLPLLFSFAGFLASALLYQRALALMPADAKAALVDAASSTRLLSVFAVSVLLVLLLWRTWLGWAFPACVYLALGVRSIFRLRRLDLPSRAARLLPIGNGQPAAQAQR